MYRTLFTLLHTPSRGTAGHHTGVAWGGMGAVPWQEYLMLYSYLWYILCASSHRHRVYIYIVGMTGYCGPKVEYLGEAGGARSGSTLYLYIQIYTTTLRLLSTYILHST